MGTVLLGRLVEEDALNRQSRIVRQFGPRRIGLNIPADQGYIPLCIRRVNVSEKTRIRVGGEFWNFASVIRIREHVWPWAATGVDHNCEVDIWMGRDPAATFSDGTFHLSFAVAFAAYFILCGGDAGNMIAGVVVGNLVVILCSVAAYRQLVNVVSL